MNFTIGLISQELSCELFIVLYLLVKKGSSAGSSSERSYIFFQVFPIHQEYLKTPKQNCDTGL